MPSEQYHEPPDELSLLTRTFARMIQSLIEEADAINWYEQRISVENDEEAKAIMKKAQRKSSFIFPWTWNFYCAKKINGKQWQKISCSSMETLLRTRRKQKTRLKNDCYTITRFS